MAYPLKAYAERLAALRYGSPAYRTALAIVAHGLRRAPDKAAQLATIERMADELRDDYAAAASLYARAPFDD